MSAWDFVFGGDLWRRLAAGPRSEDGTAQRRRQLGSSTPQQARPLHVAVLGMSAGLVLAPVVYHNQKNILQCLEDAKFIWLQDPGLAFASVTAATVAPLADVSKEVDDVSEPRTGLSFPRALAPVKKKSCCQKKAEGEAKEGPQDLAGVGVRVKRILGLAGVKVYAFGVYFDPHLLKSKLGHKYSEVPLESLRASKWLLDDVMASDCPITVRLVINYKRLKIGQVRSAFSESLGGGLEALSGKPQPELLHNFTKWFTDNIELQHGTVIDLRRGTGHTVTTSFDGKTAGSVTSALLSRALLSLYLGEKPFDVEARDAVRQRLAEALAKA